MYDGEGDEENKKGLISNFDMRMTTLLRGNVSPPNS